MAGYQAMNNTSYGNSMQFNGPIHGNVGLATDVQPSFFKTSNYESYKNVNPERVPDTCNWFLDHATFIKWRDSDDHDLLWLSADPGCGKSVLSRALIDENLLGPKSATVCHFFFKDNDEQNNTATALCALLHQFFSAHHGFLQKYAVSAVKKCGQVLKSEFEELWQVFTSAAMDPSAGLVLCVLDALDECRQADRDNLISNLEKLYVRFLDMPRQGSKLKFLVTSRPYDNIEYRFRTLTQRIPTIRLAGEEESEHISREIGIVIESKVKEIAEARHLDEDVRRSLQRRLCEIPNRTYLWLHLTLNAVKNARGKTQRKLHNVIDTLPRTVEEAYEKLLARCDERDEEAARKIFQIVVAAQRPLTLNEIDVALEITPNTRSYADPELDLEGDARKEYIRSACGLFVSIVNNRVFLIHQTAREFLIRKAGRPLGQQGWQYSVDLERAHQVLSEICISHLLFREFQEYPIIVDFDNGFSHNEWMHRSALRKYAEKHAFLDYSANYWITHVKEAHTDRATWIPKAAMLCNIGDGQYCTWFRLYSQSNYTAIPESRRSALYWAAVFGLINEARYLLDHDLASNEQQAFIDAIHAAAGNESHGKELVGLFLARGGIMVTEEVVKAAAGNRSSGKEVMALLLAQREQEVQITEEVVKAAAGNWSSGKEVMALLLEQRGQEVQITEEVVKAAAGNDFSGKEVMALLLAQREQEVQITEEVVKAAAGNDFSGKEVMALLLAQREQEVQITEEVVKAAAGNRSSGKEVMALLLEQRGGTITDVGWITQEIARSFDIRHMKAVLAQRGQEVQITEEVVKAAAGNGSSGKEVMALLLAQREQEVQITEEVVKAAAGNWSSGKEVMALLLEQRGQEVQITEEVVKAAAGNDFSGKEVMALLLEQRGQEVQITEEVVKAAAGNGSSGKEVMALLLEQRGQEVQITEEVVKAAAGNDSSGKEVMALLLEQRGQEVQTLIKLCNIFENLTSTLSRISIGRRWLYIKR